MIIYTDKGWMNRKDYKIIILGYTLSIRIERKAIKTRNKYK